MAALQPFSPSYAQGKTVIPAASAASTTIVKDALSVCLTNLGENICYVRIGASGIIATVADFPVLAGEQITLTKKSDDDTISYISALGTTLHVITGEGWRN